MCKPAAGPSAAATRRVKECTLGGFRQLFGRASILYLLRPDLNSGAARLRLDAIASIGETLMSHTEHRAALPATLHTGEARMPSRLPTRAEGSAPGLGRGLWLQVGLQMGMGIGMGK